MIKKLLRNVLPFILVSLSNTMGAQIISGTDTLFGNEWIQNDQQYFKFYTDRDALIKINYVDLQKAGVPVSSILGSQWQVWHNGKEVPIWVSTGDQWSSNDYILLYGFKNRSEMDAPLYLNPDKEILNPEYSLVTDSCSYFLTWVSRGKSAKRIEIVHPTSSALSNYIMVKQLTEFHSNHIDKYYDASNEITLSSFDECEGFGSAPVRNFEKILSPVNPYSGNVDGTIQIRFATINLVPSFLGHKYRVYINNKLVLQDSSNGYRLVVKSINIANADLQKDISLKIECYGQANGQISVSGIQFIYPRNKISALTQNDKIISAEADSYFSSPIQSDNSLLIDEINHIWYAPFLLNKEYYHTLNKESIYTITDLGNPRNISGLIPLTFENISTNPNANYVIITHSLFADAVKSYADYRSSVPGGSYKVKTVFIDQIYNQFGYGYDRHILGLKNFAQFIQKKWTGVDYVLMIGKAINYRDLRVGDGLKQYGFLDLIPTLGYPGSDNQIFAKDVNSAPAINIGRLAATRADQILTYLNKVKVYESSLVDPKNNDDLYWRKKILHLAGGVPGAGGEGFDNFVNGFKSILEASSYNAMVSTVTKTSSDPIQGGLSEIAKNIINNGVAIKTYLGHGAISATELGLDDPEFFNNKGKYPVTFTMGCNTGNIHTSGVSLSESFIFSMKGDINYFASSGIGYDANYAAYGNDLYQNFGNQFFDKPVSSAHAHSLNEVKQNIEQSLIQQFSLHGDPAIKLNYYKGHDYTLDPKSFKTIPENLQTDLDSFNIVFTAWNLGYEKNRDLDIKVQHITPDGKTLVYTLLEKLSGPNKEISFRLPMPVNSTGANKILIQLDPDNKINELPLPFAESNNELNINNQAGIVVNIYSNDVRPIEPPDFGIVGNADIQLKAFSSDAFKSGKFLFQIDTTALFNSPFLKSIITIQRSGMITWKPGFPPEPNRVYYWRVAGDTTGKNQPLFWSTRSFIYLPGQGPGWNQSHAFQFIQNPDAQAMKYNIDHRKWEMFERSSFVASSINQALDPAEYSKVIINGARYTRNNGNYKSEIILTVWDTIQGLVRNPVGGRDSATNVFGVSAPGYYFSMQNNTAQERKNLIYFLENGIRDGQYGILITHVYPGSNYHPESWSTDSNTIGKTVAGVLTRLGARQVNQLTEGSSYSYPYVFVFKKGFGAIGEKISDDSLQARIAFDLPSWSLNASHQSAILGPAKNWNKFEWKIQDQREAIHNKIRIYGIHGNTSTLLADTMTQDLDLNFISANQYPYLQLLWNASDSTKSTSVNLAYWRVLFSSLQDLAIASNEDYEFFKDTIDQGDEVRWKFNVYNAGDLTVDSFQVTYTIKDPQNNISNDTLRFYNLHGREKTMVNKTFETSQRSGLNILTANIIDLSGNSETQLNNNRGSQKFLVISDKIPPVIHVFFNGRQIANNEIVSRQPEIVINLKDNKSLSTKDSQQVSLSVKYPNGNFTAVSPKEYFITYNNNEVIVNYRPQFVVGGTYTLKVNGKDKSGNPAGNIAYEINFRIINENSISSILPYPNPMTSQCRFAYTLTGDNPAIFKLQIMTVAGRVVRELTQSDLGSLQEGTHLTDRAWDCTDEYGNKLATGTYLYRVITKDTSGKTYSSYESIGGDIDGDARKYFTKGIGKLVILR